MIVSGELAPGDPLPSEAELCEKFNSSRGPVRQAVAALRAEGLISSGRGRRSMVLFAPSASSFDAMISATALIEEEGRTPGARILRIAREEAGERAAEALHLEPGDSVVEVTRLRSADDMPLVIERITFPYKIGEPFLTLTSDSASLHQLLADRGITIDNVIRIVRISTATADDAELLGIEEGAAVWNIELRASTFQGEPVEYAQYRFRGDVVSMTMSNVRGSQIPIKFTVTPPDSDEHE